MKFKTAYDSKMPRVQFETRGPTLTRQAFKSECDINRVMRQFEKTGVLEHRNTFEGAYGDYTNVPQDYHEAVNQVLAADEMFSTLPAKIRKRFGNDPAEYVDFVSDPANKDELVSLGLSKGDEKPKGAEVIETPPKKEKATDEPKKEVPEPPK